MSYSIYDALSNLVNTIVGFDILVLTMAFILSFSNLLSKDPYMSKTYRVPLHYILYFLLGLLLSYMCFKKVQKYRHFYRDLFIVCLIFILAFSFFFFQLTYHDDILNLYIRLSLSAGTSILFVCIYSLHIYYENKDLVN